MKQVSINPGTLKFLKDLSKNNNRDWFNSHKDLYLTANENMSDFVDQLIGEMNKHDLIENVSGKKSLYRIYNDVRFSKDKSPYNARFAFGLRRATKLKRGGYYMSVKPGNSYIACGFFNPNADDLKRIRQDIEMNHEDWKRILNATRFKNVFGNLQGEKLITAPRGFDKNHPAVDLIRHKQFIVKHNFSDEEVIAGDFLMSANNTFKSVRPFFNYLSEVLTTNSNGELIV